MKKIIGIIVVLVSVIIAICCVVFLNKQQEKKDNTSVDLNRLLYEIVEESYLNYGDITYSKYKDIVSPQDYKSLYYLGVIDYNDPKEGFLDRSKMEILISYHSTPTTVVQNNRATSNYYYESKYIIKETPSYLNSYPRYEKDNCILSCSHVTVEWELQNETWHIVDVVDPP